MTIDERLDRLTERHEALTQTVELIAGMQRQNEERLAVVRRDNEERLTAMQRHNEERFADMRRQTEERFARNEERLGQLMDAMNRLIRVVEIHERRLDDLEGT